MELYAPAPAPVTTFVSSSPMTVDELHTNFPPGVSVAGLYARVSDLYGQVDDVMRCRFDGVSYKWVPQRPDFSVTSAQASGAMALNPLATPPSIFLTSTILLTTTLTITPSVTRAFIGQRFRIRTPPSILGQLVVSGLAVGSINLGGAQDRFLEYTSSGWQG